MQEHNTEGKGARYAISTAKDSDPKKVIVISCSEKDAEKYYIKYNNGQIYI